MNANEKQVIKTFKEQTQKICAEILNLLKIKDKLYYESLVKFEDPKMGSRALNISLYEIQCSFEEQQMKDALNDLNEFDEENFNF